MPEKSDKRISGGGIRVGKPFGIEIELHWSWFIFFGALVWGFSKFFCNVAPESPTAIHWTFGTLTTLLLFSSLIFHELAHSLIARKFFKITIKKITLFIFGGAAQFEGKDSKDYPIPSAKAEFWMSIAGPVSSFMLAGLFFGLSSLLTGTVSLLVLAMLNYLFLINLILGIFNLVPCFPMDGGRIFRSFLWWKTKNLLRATRIAYRVGMGTGVALPVAGFFLAGVWGAVWIGFIVFLIIIPAARSEYQRVVQKTISESFAKLAE